jgi:hypothetical protein
MTQIAFSTTRKRALSLAVMRILVVKYNDFTVRSQNDVLCKRCQLYAIGSITQGLIV